MNKQTNNSNEVDAGLELAKHIFDKVLATPIEQLGLLFTDKLRYWRFKNQMRNLEKVKKICDENSIKLKQINLKILVPYLEGVSLEEDELLHEMWANLFVNYIDASKNLTQSVYPQILKQMSTEEANLLFKIEELKGKIRFGVTDKSGSINSLYNINTLSNLHRLGLINEIIDVTWGGDGVEDGNEYLKRFNDINSGIIPNEGYYLTDFGYHFLKACRR